MRKVVWLVLSCLMVVALTLASCQTAPPAVQQEGQEIKGQVTQPTTPTTTAPAEEEKAEEEATPVAATTPQYGGTLRVAACFMNWTGGPASWDMVKWTWGGHAYASLVFDSLLMADFDKGP